MSVVDLGVYGIIVLYPGKTGGSQTSIFWRVACTNCIIDFVHYYKYQEEFYLAFC